MFHVVLYEPEIPANTGNIGRLCVAVGATLHIAGQPGFRFDDRHLRRAGLDYWADVRLVRHDDLAAFERTVPADRLFCLSTRGQTLYTDAAFRPGDAFVFGGESRGLPAEVLARHAGRTLALPMPGGKVRSLNLAGAAHAVVYEALRQVGMGAGGASADREGGRRAPGNLPP